MISIIEKVIVNQIYKHFKGKEVMVIARAQHEESLQWFITYIDLTDGRMWIRPEKDWFVDISNHPMNFSFQKKRFKKKQFTNYSVYDMI